MTGNATIIELPQVGESVTEGTIVQWLKGVGDHVDRYDPLVEVLTDKVSMEVPSPVAGVITELLAEEGQTLPMGAPIASIQTEDAVESPAPNRITPAAPTEEPQSIDRTGVLLKDVAPVGPTGSRECERKCDCPRRAGCDSVRTSGSRPTPQTLLARGAATR